MEYLPPEVALHVLTFLDVTDLVSITSVSRSFYKLGRDNQQWSSRCYEKSYDGLSHARHRTGTAGIQQQAAAALSSLSVPESHGEQSSLQASHAAIPADVPLSAKAENLRSMANWDPSYPSERVDWYGEYVARYGPISMSWLQPPDTVNEETPKCIGLGLHSVEKLTHVVAPIDDGGVCIWDIGTLPATGRRGAIIARSKPGILSAGNHSEGANAKSNLISTGVVECVSVDNCREKAYIAVHNGLFEIDLSTLQVSRYEKYASPISALSEYSNSVPLTVGTNSSLHLFDHRRRNNSRTQISADDCLDAIATFPIHQRTESDFHRLILGDNLQYAPLAQPNPLSIHHISPEDVHSPSSGNIYVAGRFPSILVYDRRTFPRLQTTIHSGSRLSSLTSLPFSFDEIGEGLMRQNQLDTHAVEQIKITSGNRLIACGEYGGKGSLEIYGLSSHHSLSDSTAVRQPGASQMSTFKNRVTASRSKLLSVATHGTRIVVSDSDGNLRWLGRNGSTFIRSWNIGSFAPEPQGIFSSSYGPQYGDLSRKLIPTMTHGSMGSVDQDQLLVWTGERIGVVGFTVKPKFGGEDGVDWDEKVESFQDRMKGREEKVYGETMKRALQVQADEARWMQGLGFETTGP